MDPMVRLLGNDFIDPSNINLMSAEQRGQIGAELSVRQLSPQPEARATVKAGAACNQCLT